MILNAITKNSKPSGLSKFGLITFVLSTLTLVLSACASSGINRQNNLSISQSSDNTMPTQKVYATQPLYFHYFKIDVPEDINLDKSINEASFAGNRFHAYPIESQQAFTDMVERHINIFSSHKISQSALDYERKSFETVEELNLQDIKKYNPKLNMTTALYKAIKYDDQRYEIIANSLNNLDSTFNTAMYVQWFIYVPEQHKYIMTDQAKFPARHLVEEPNQKAAGQNFLDNKVSPLNATTLRNPNNMAVGPVVRLNPVAHPVIDYSLSSKQHPIDIKLEAGGVSKSNPHRIKGEQKFMLNQLEDNAGEKAKHLDSGSRTVADMRGREVCYAFAPTKYEKPYIWCSWGTDGQYNDLDHPYISVDMTYELDGTEAERKKAMAAWEQLLGSLQRRGHS